jgi:hypothetical protein
MWIRPSISQSKRFHLSTREVMDYRKTKKMESLEGLTALAGIYINFTN